MDIAAISAQLSPTGLDKTETAPGTEDPAKVAKVSRQFESILLRQFLGESLKPLLESGPSGQIYGYMLTDSLAEKISEAGGLGLAHVLQTQISPKHK
jgi:flagellar protein FlgJ